MYRFLTCNKKQKMQENFDTSRWVVVDLIEMIKEQLAIYSHLQELYKEVVDNIDAAVNSWANDDYVDELRANALHIRNNIKDVYERRQKSMAELKKLAIKYDRKCHCLLKHAIKERGIAEEVWNTNKDNGTYEALMLDAENYMYKVLSQYLWTEIVTCWRCLTDELLPPNYLANGEEK